MFVVAVWFLVIGFICTYNNFKWKRGVIGEHARIGQVRSYINTQQSMQLKELLNTVQLHSIVTLNKPILPTHTSRRD